jgi:hypothetical protein
LFSIVGFAYEKVGLYIRKVGIMKMRGGVAFLSLLLVSALFADSEQQSPNEDFAPLEDSEPKSSNKEPAAADEFLELAEPQRNISGAYYGAGLTLSSISHGVKVEKAGQPTVDFKKTSVQFDLSLIGGFGSAFYKQYYAGLELELFKRLGGKTSYHNDGNVGLTHHATIGLNMDVRFGYLFPEQGCLAYTTVGFARVLGRVAIRDDAKQNKREGSFGSFYPTFGVGVERKINHRWNVRADLRLSITSKESEKHVAGWKYEGKPNRTAFRISITRSI